MTSVRSTHARLERRRAEDAATVLRVVHSVAPPRGRDASDSAADDVLPGDGDLAWLGIGLIAASLAVAVAVVWLVATGRLPW